MKRVTGVLSILLLLLIALPVMADTPTPGTLSVEPAVLVTQEAAPVATAEATAPAETSGVVINFEADNDNDDTASDNASFAEIVLLISNVIAYGIILAQAVMQNGSINRKTLDSFFTGLKGLGKFIPGTDDDRFIAGLEAGANALLGERKPELPNTPGSAAG